MSARRERVLQEEAEKTLKSAAKRTTAIVKDPESLTESEKEELVVEFRGKARKLARSILRKWHSRLDLEEVDSVVDLSLCEAVHRFNPTKGASFMTFLYYHLRGNLIRTVSTAANLNMIPIAEFESLVQLEGDGAQSSRASGMSKIVNSAEIASALSSGEYQAPDELISQQEIVQLSQKALEKLDALEREVIIRLYYNEEQLLDIAYSLGYSRCHISRVKRKALETLSTELSAHLEMGDRVIRRDFADEVEDKVRRKLERRKVTRRAPRSRVASGRRRAVNG